VVFLKGYGTVDGPGTRRVDPTTDQFQIASVSKTFTAALLSQLLDRGQISSINSPLNAYLKRSQVPDWRGQPLTLRQLVTHSAGFEERGFGYFDHSRTGATATGHFLMGALPSIVRPPGTRVVYANVDPALVGAAIEDMTGQPLRQYMAERLFGPLGMTHSELNYAADGGPRLVKAFAGTQQIPGTFNNPFFAPTGSVQASAVDMAAFMNAMLGYRPDVLSPAALSYLTTRQFGNDPALDGLGMYWFLTKWGRYKIVEHAGGLQGVAAWVILIPERHTGVFIAWSGGAPPLDYGVLHDSFLLAALGPPTPPRDLSSPESLAQYAGRYRDERRPQTTPEVIGFLGDSVRTVRPDHGGLMIGAKGPFRQTAPGVFVEQAKPGRLGSVVVLRNGELLERVNYAKHVSALEDPETQQWIGLVSLLLTISAILSALWPKGWAKRPALIMGLAAASVPLALFLPGVDGGLSNALQHGDALRFDIVTAAMAAIALCGVALSVGVTRCAGPDWRGSCAARAATVHAVLVLAGAVGIVAVLLDWNFWKLLG
jgi:CubicO group peptidase (beta-lactamase class C family)